MSGLSRTMALSVLLVLGCLAAVSADLNVPITNMKLVGLPGVKATAAAECPAGVAFSAAFAKATEERRLLAVTGVVEGDASGAKALAVKLRVKLAEGDAPRLAVVAFDDAGGSWYKVSGQPVTLDEVTESRVSMAALRQTAFSDSADTAPDLGRLERLWFGLVMDGPVSGTLDVMEARLTDEPYRPTKPLRVTGDGPGKWSASENEAVTSTLTTPNEGPDGQACMKYEFTAPTGSHRWMIPSTPILASDLEGYTALRFKYKAELPEGIPGLLVLVQERGGGGWFADPPPPASADWREATIPLDTLKFATWTKDDNGKFDLALASNVQIGAHGTPKSAGGPSLIMVADIEFVP